MNWTDYQEKALETVIYPKEYGMAYTNLGLVDELHEFYDAIGSGTEVDELSDCLWYVACFAHECQIDLVDTEELASELEDQFSFCDVFDATAQARDAANRICGHTKKYIRGDLDALRKSRIQLELALIILSLEYICKKFNITFTEVAQLNIKKLASRKKRGVLKGNDGQR